MKKQALSFIEIVRETAIFLGGLVGSDLDRAVCDVIYLPTSLSCPVPSPLFQA